MTAAAVPGRADSEGQEAIPRVETEKLPEPDNTATLDVGCAVRTTDLLTHQPLDH
jgi:hypothetical protein